MHNFASLEIRVEEMNDHSWVVPTNSLDQFIGWPEEYTDETHAVTRTTSFSSLISVYLPYWFSCICFMRSTLLLFATT